MTAIQPFRGKACFVLYIFWNRSVKIARSGSLKLANHYFPFFYLIIKLLWEEHDARLKMLSISLSHHLCESWCPDVCRYSRWQYYSCARHILNIALILILFHTKMITSQKQEALLTGRITVSHERPKIKRGGSEVKQYVNKITPWSFHDDLFIWKEYGQREENRVWGCRGRMQTSRWITKWWKVYQVLVSSSQ